MRLPASPSRILKWQLKKKNAEISIENLPVIKGDKRMMGQLFENFISNSLKYSKQDDKPRIKITYSKGSDDIELIFQDNGIGFDERYLDQMFTLFQRLHDRNSYEGTGLGLAICKKIVDIHRGRISASSKEGMGAKFIVTFPLSILI